jgi:hypothetical protein
MAIRREKNLCYNCEETFSPQHRCKARFHLFISDDPLPDPAIDTLPESPPPPDPSEGLISLHALSGCSAAATIRLTGYINNHPVTVLIDGGSTHNFIQVRMAKFLELPSIPTSPLKVMVGNGSLLKCVTLCPAVILTIQTTPFTLDLHPLPLCGADIVLGAPWLKTIGPVLMDYNNFHS